MESFLLGNQGILISSWTLLSLCYDPIIECKNTILSIINSQFACYDENEEVISMEDRDVYQKDLFGLRSLDLRDNLFKYTVQGIQHLQWHRNISLIDRYIIPHLD
jgi:hypothetical protein